ncbi:cytochrome P450 [Pseudomonas sp. N040]|uniref:cytochrome P450 n=1 Tax=Pseudomonas sp. N040 TaxID=2785325 RepID=UPI0018A33949|nr:cytochrome P450 [Pseudomonas sp. N040]MBF7729779.1 cytochrome P450 [Pseudomonas sp. N040]MBW7013421.1 cytochrome P450 [Pseudomonas sp. N040]
MAFDPNRFNPHDPSYLANPYPTYALFRQQAPVHRVHASVPVQGRDLTLYDSTWVFRYADVKRVLEDSQLFLKSPPSPPAPPPPFDVLQNMPVGIFSMNPPRHNQLRPILDELFAVAIDKIDGVAQGIASSLLDSAQSRQRIELVSAYANPLPAAVLQNVLGIPERDWQGVQKWVEGVVAGHDYTAPVAAQMLGGTCAMALGGYFQALTRGCPVQANKGGMVDLMVNQAEPQGMLRDEVQMTLVNLAVAGYLSSVFLLATGTLNLLQNPAQLALLRDHPELMDNAIEELLRYDAPAQLADRYCAQATEIAGVQLQAGDQVTAVLGSANRDPQVFGDADTLDIRRTNAAAHLGFGDGIHHCLGAPLVRRVAPVAFRALLQRLPALRLAGLPQWQTDPYLRSVVNLPVAIG